MEDNTLRSRVLPVDGEEHTTQPPVEDSSSHTSESGSDDDDDDDIYDSILDQALNDFQQTKDQPTDPQPSQQTQSDADHPSSSTEAPGDNFSAEESAAVESLVRELLKMSGEDASGNDSEDLTEETKKLWTTMMQSFRNEQGGPNAPPSTSSVGSDFQSNIQETLRMMAESAQNLQQDAAGMGSGSANDVSQSLADAFEKLIGDMGGEDSPEVDNMFEAFVGQLMSKELMYGPMKEACEKYPEWLERNRTNPAIPKDQYTKYEKQYGLLQKLVEVYESTPSDNAKIYALMEEISVYGQPPADLIDSMSQEGSSTPPMDPNNCSVM